MIKECSYALKKGMDHQDYLPLTNIKNKALGVNESMRNEPFARIWGTIFTAIKMFECISYAMTCSPLPTT